MKFLLVFALLLIPATALAAQHEPTLGRQLLDNFELSAGFRWTPEEVQNFLGQDGPPFYLGANLKLPLSEKAGFFGDFDRDLTQAPHFQVRAGMYFKPYYKD